MGVSLTKSDRSMETLVDSADGNSRLVRLVLASGSPRRKALLESLGARPEIVPGNLDEHTELRDPSRVVEFLSLEKARAVAADLPADKHPCVVLGADTIVVLGERILGKPDTRKDAYDMLMTLSGKQHQVYTGVSLVDSSGVSESLVCVSNVYFRTLHPQEVECYVATDEPMDKAGAYALQGIAAAFVEKVEGCYTNIIGLPLPDTISLLRRHGVRVLGMP